MEASDAVPGASHASKTGLVTDNRPSYSSKVSETSVLNTLVRSSVPRGIDDKCAISIDVEKDIPAETYAKSVADVIGSSALQYAGRRSGKLII